MKEIRNIQRVEIQQINGLHIQDADTLALYEKLLPEVDANSEEITLDLALLAYRNELSGTDYSYDNVGNLKGGVGKTGESKHTTTIFLDYFKKLPVKYQYAAFLVVMLYLTFVTLVIALLPNAQAVIGLGLILTVGYPFARLMKTKEAKESRKNE